MKLSDELIEHFRLTLNQKKALLRLRITTVEDLLFHFPNRYENIGNTEFIGNLSSGDTATVYGTLSGLKTKKTFKSRVPAAEGRISDSTGSIKVMWFNQPYIAKMYREGVPVRASGKITGKSTLYLSNPEITEVDGLPTDLHKSLFEDGKKVDILYPVYSESKGMTSKWMYHAINKIFASDILDNLHDPIDESLLKKYNLPTRKTALIWAHTPKKKEDAKAARKRFAFEEVFFIQLFKQQERHENSERKTLSIKLEQKDIDKFVKRFPFKLTDSQNEAIEQIVEDLRKGYPMSRLLEGDVGSGKTAVAATTMYSAIMTPPEGKDYGNLQTAYMCPTEILAKQHFESFMELFSHLPINIGLITSSGCKKFPSKVNKGEATNISRAQLLKWVEDGSIPILVGTHSLIQKTVKFKNLAYVIIDEQHRFGTGQRQKLARKDGIAPHLLSMTATPIPRTLALTIYGDLDLTLLKQMPKGRKPIITEVVTPESRNKMYEKVRQELESGRQVYVICPRIDEPDPDKLNTLNVKSVKAEARRLKETEFKEYEIDILHSKIKPSEKDEIMEAFSNGATDILVATSVVEVGVNVPNATVIIIEGAERFGLAQLHQLRGRVIRSNHQAYCYAFANTKSKTSVARLKALTTAKNGFELAEEDLKIRGTGELYGKKQWGISDIGMEAIKNIKMVEAARNEAAAYIKSDPLLVSRPLLKKAVRERAKNLHFE
jgi:ATP-dependent DNA helicase RecG